MSARRIAIVGLLAWCAGVALTGCESMRRERVVREDEHAARSLTSSRLTDEAGLDVDGRPIFASKRLSGGLSSEAREIEQNMNAGR